MRKIILSLFLFLVLTFKFSVSPAHAQLESCGIDTAIGCIPVENTDSFMGWILGWAIGVGGGIAFLLIVYASFMIMTSQGDPTRLKAGQELLTSAISGLIMLIFSVFILKFIGIDILGLGNFGFN
jgi:small-conductance mechanosensitive channel